MIAPLVSGLVSGFLHDGLEYVYTETGIQNAGTMDHRPAGAGISWTSTVRLQVYMRSRTIFQIQVSVYRTMEVYSPVQARIQDFTQGAPGV